MPCYNMKRTICDILRLRSHVDEQIVLGSLKAYVRRCDKRLDRLSSYAQQLGISGLVNRFLAALL